MHVCMRVCMYEYMFVCMYVYICMCIYSLPSYIYLPIIYHFHFNAMILHKF